MAKEKKPEITSEHVFTIPLRSAWSGSARVRRANRGVSAVRSFIMKNTRAKSVKMSTKLNESLWKGGAKRPPHSVRVKASVDTEGIASVKLPEEITLEEEKKKFLDEKKAKGKQGEAEKGQKPQGPEEAAAKAPEKPASVENEAGSPKDAATEAPEEKK